MSSFTPGPWEAFVGEDGGFVISPKDNPHVGLCSRAPWPQRGKESGANARLIAAAPTMLHALLVVAAQLDDIDGLCNPEACEAVRAAIVKATGGEA